MKKRFIAIVLICFSIALYGADEFDKHFKMIIQNEGTTLFVDTEKGEISKYGITLATLISNDYDMNGDGEVNVKDVHAINTRKARIFYNNFYYKPILRLKQAKGLYSNILFDQVLDTGVNMGTRTSVRLLQKAINESIRLKRINGDKSLRYISIDGLVGNETVKALKKCNIKEVNNTLVYLRNKKYKWIIEKDPYYERWSKSWFRRSNEFYIK